jgi:hypothetical protein
LLCVEGMKAALFAIASTALFVATGNARADLARHEDPQAASGPTVEAARPRRTLAFSVNPLAAAFVGRWGGNIDYSPVPHHALELSFSYLHADSWGLFVSDGVDPNASTDVTVNRNRIRGGVGEIGYRYYTGSDGPTGLFAGPSLVVEAGRAGTQSFGGAGAAFDVGAQTTTSMGLVFGVGVGGQMLFLNRKLDADHALVLSGKITARLLLNVGWSI